MKLSYLDNNFRREMGRNGVSISAEDISRIRSHISDSSRMFDSMDSDRFFGRRVFEQLDDEEYRDYGRNNEIKRGVDPTYDKECMGGGMGMPIEVVGPLMVVGLLAPIWGPPVLLGYVIKKLYERNKLENEVNQALDAGYDTSLKEAIATSRTFRLSKRRDVFRYVSEEDALGLLYRELGRMNGYLAWKLKHAVPEKESGSFDILRDEILDRYRIMSDLEACLDRDDKNLVIN
tara:strand:+ start:242 stop:940 length:699 start_codon:yes stop_codon:yes gene_type:complete